MTVLDAEFGTDLTPSEGGGTLWSLPIVAPACEPLDWASVLEEAEARIEEERGRARVAELRREELRRSERDARAVANSLTRQLDTCRFKLKAAAPKTASRAVKTLERRVESQDAEISDLRITLRRSHEHQEQVEARHQDEINWLKQDIDRGRSRLARMYREGERVAESLRRQFDRRLAAAQRLVEAREGTIAWLRERNDRLRAAIVRATELIASLRKKNAELRAEVRGLKGENARWPRVSRSWNSTSTSCARPGASCPRRSTPAGASGRRSREPGASAASSAAPPDTGGPSAPGSGRRRSRETRRRMRACVRVAASPMPPTASGAPLCSRTMSRPTRTPSCGRAGAGVATAPPRRGR